ncbi:hypothetical protein C8R46DRAFT_1040322 [Mycena filopes]|nr:hypothetical protein C8R46DRAFT_1040322 [Mycena filopes]
MQFTLKSAFVALAAALAVAAAPAGPSTDSALVDGHIFLCTDVNFGGDCVNWGFFDNVCSTFPSEFQDDISSFGPDKGWICTLYTDNGCEGQTYTSGNPGAGTLPGEVNDQFSSVRCVRS